LKKNRYKSILLILCLSMFSSVLSLGFVRAELSTASPGGLTETIYVFDHRTANTNIPAIETITIKDIPVESVIMFLEAKNGDYIMRAIHFDVDGYRDGVLGTPPGVGGAILTWRVYKFNVRGPGVLYGAPGSPGYPNQKSFTIDMSDECYFATGVNYEKHYHNFIPQDPSQTVGYFSPGDHIITAFVTGPSSHGHSWITIRLEITYSYIPAEVEFHPETLNRKSQGKWVTVYIDLPDEYNEEDIDLSTIKLNGVVPAEESPTGIDDGILMVKFDRQAFIATHDVGESIEITVTGELFDGTPFEGSDDIRALF